MQEFADFTKEINLVIEHTIIFLLNNWNIKGNKKEALPRDGTLWIASHRDYDVSISKFSILSIRFCYQKACDIEDKDRCKVLQMALEKR